MKYMLVVESGGSRAFIYRIISDGFMSPISGNLCTSNALAQRSLVYLDISSSFSCSYVSAAFSSISARLSLMLLASQNGNKDTPCWTTPASATAARLSCCRTCAPSCPTRR